MVQEQGNAEAHEILRITDTVQCESRYNYATSEHTYCKCGLILPGASDEVQKQVLKNMTPNCITKAHEHYKSAVTKKKYSNIL